MKEALKKLLLDAGACDAGICRARIYSEQAAVLQSANADFCEADIQKRINPFLIMPDAKSVIVYAVSYKSSLCGNISSYAYGKDYHRVLPEIARPAAEMLLSQNYSAAVFSDTGELPDRYLAYLSGLGFFGKNHCLIHPKYGSFIFIGYILTNCPLPQDTPLASACAGCGECVRACPSGALQNGDFSLCLSHITQKKGTLSPAEEALIKSSGTIWGCDICQNVCPHNLRAPDSAVGDFCGDPITNLSLPEDISNREFKRLFGDRAFSWRGKNVLLRNQRIINS